MVGQSLSLTQNGSYGVIIDHPKITCYLTRTEIIINIIFITNLNKHLRTSSEVETPTDDFGIQEESVCALDGYSVRTLMVVYGRQALLLSSLRKLSRDTF